MTRLNSKTFALACVLALASTSAHAESAYDNVQDNRGGKVIDARGNCVRTKWMDGADPCAPAVAAPTPAPVAAPAPAPAPQPVVKLAEEDLTIYFGFDKANITPESSAKLDRIANVLKSDTQVTGARIVGFTDSVGGSDYNIKLSEKRAAAVKDYIASKGYFNTEIAKVQGVGKSYAKEDCAKLNKLNDKIACGAEDRKVMVQIQYRYVAK